MSEKFRKLGWLLLISFASSAVASGEVEYQRATCNGVVGATLRDKVSGKVIGYVDCLTETHAIEYDWANGTKIYEAIGQALYYAMHTGRRAGIILIRSDDAASDRYVSRARSIIEHYGLPIDLDVMDADISLIEKKKPP